jgi:chemotaxis-related protein WspB
MLLLVFYLGDERYALEGSRVVEVIPMVTLRRLPHAPDHVAGLFNYRGGVVPVIELGQLIQGRPCHPCLSTRIILVTCVSPRDQTPHTLGLMAERVTETIQKSKADLVPSGIAVKEAPYLGEIILDEGGMIQCVHLDHLLPESLSDALFHGQAEQALGADGH